MTIHPPITKLQVAMFQFLRSHLAALALRRFSTAKTHGAGNDKGAAALEPTQVGEVGGKLMVGFDPSK